MNSISNALAGAGWEIWVTLNQMAPYVLLGFLLAALLRAVLPEKLVAAHLGEGRRAVLKAAVLGIPLPLCSCGVAPAAIGLRRQGAGRGATTAFLIATPETGIDSIAITYGLLGPLMAVFRPVAAFLTAIAAGLLENATDDKPSQLPPPQAGCCDCCAQEVEPCNECRDRQSLSGRLKASFGFAFGELLSDTGKWLLGGVAAAGLLAYALPDDFLSRHLGRGIVPMLVMLVAGVPLYVCASCATPVAAALMLKGLSPGAALVFLLTGPATNVATMMVVGRFLGRKSLAIYIGSIAVMAVLLGFALDFISQLPGLQVVPSLAADEEESIGWASGIMSLLLVGLIVRSLLHHPDRAASR